jgi:DNA-binding phage protein
VTGQPIPQPVEVTAAHVRTARHLLKSGRRGLSEVAAQLGVSTRALDRALWLWMGEPL